MSEAQVPTPLSQAEQVSQKIADLKTKLQTAAPGYESMLHIIHVTLSKDENLVQFLSDEEVGVICAGLSKRKGVILSEQATKSTRGKALSKISADDL